MKFIFNTIGNILESETTESIIQFSVNANEIYMTFAGMPMSEYIGYISFERADGKTSPLIGMQYCSFPSPSGEPMIGFKYSFSDAWVTAIAGILKVVFTLKQNGIVIKTATINLNVIESIAEDEVNYIDDVAYNELLSRMQSFEITAENISATNLIQGQKIKDLASKLNSTIIHNNVGSIQSKSTTNEINTLITKGVYLLQQIQYDEGSISHPITALMFVKEITSGIWVQTILFEFRDRINYLTRTIDSRTGNININISERKIITHADDIPTRLSQLQNDSNYVDESFVENYVNEKTPTRLSQLENDSDFVNTSELKEYVNSKSPKNIGELESDPQNKNNIILNHLNEDGIYHFTYQGVNGIIFVRKLVLNPNYPGNFDVIQTILYNPVESNCDISTVRRTLSFIRNSLTYTDIFNQGTLATTQEYLSYLQEYFYNKEKVNELLSLIPKFSIEVVETLPTSEISDTTVYLIPSGDEDNLYTEYIYVNGKWEVLGIQTVDLSNYAKISDIPTKTSQLQNDSGFLNQHQDLSDYATKKFVNDALNNLGDFDFTNDYEALKNRPVINLGGILRNEERIDSADCPTLNALFFNKYGGYFYTFDYIEYKHIMFIDRINPQTQTILQFAEGKINVIRRVKAEDGTITVTTDSLSTKNDIPTKLSQLENDSNYVNKSYVDTKVANLVNSAPEALDTLKELSSALGNDPNFATTVSTEIGKKENKANLKALAYKDSLSKSDVGLGNVLNVASYSKTETDNLLSSKANTSQLFSGKYDDLTGKPTIPTKTSELTNDSGYLTTHQDISGKADKSYVDTKVANLVNSAPETLDTLGELAEAINNHKDSYDALLEVVGNKANRNELPTKLSELVQDSSDYLEKYGIIEENPTSLLFGRWKFKEYTYITGIDTDIELSCQFKDNLGNTFNRVHLVITPNDFLILGITPSLQDTIEIYNSTAKTGLAFNNDGTLKNYYYLVALTDNNYILPRLLLCANKYIEVDLNIKADKSYVDNELAKKVDVEGYVAYSQEEKDKLSSLENYDDTDLENRILALELGGGSGGSSSNTIYLDVELDEYLDPIIDENFIQNILNIYSEGKIKNTVIKRKMIDEYDTIDYLTFIGCEIPSEPRGTTTFYWSNGKYNFYIYTDTYEGVQDYGYNMYDTPDSDTKNTTGSSQNNSSKLYLVGARNQSSYDQTYSNSKVYISGNHVYSNGHKTLTTDNAYFNSSITYGRSIGYLTLGDESGELLIPGEFRVMLSEASGGGILYEEPNRSSRHFNTKIVTKPEFGIPFTPNTKILLKFPQDENGNTHEYVLAKGNTVDESYPYFIPLVEIEGMSIGGHNYIKVSSRFDMITQDEFEAGVAGAQDAGLKLLTGNINKINEEFIIPSPRDNIVFRICMSDDADLCEGILAIKTEDCIA